MFFHVLYRQKVIEGGPWTFEQSLLLQHKLESNEDPHIVKLNTTDMWVHVFDLPSGMLTEQVLQSIGNSIGTYVKSDPTNFNGVWKLFSRIRVTLNIDNH